jgi:hypothetical protein
MIGHRDTTYSDELQQAGKRLIGRQFLGVYPADRVPPLKNSASNAYLIVNTDNSDEPGSHWIGIVKQNNAIYMYDSFGRNPEELSSEFEGMGYIPTNPNIEQDIEENDCGIRSLTFLVLSKQFGADQVSKVI